MVAGALATTLTLYMVLWVMVVGMETVTSFAVEFVAGSMVGDVNDPLAPEICTEKPLTVPVVENGTVNEFPPQSVRTGTVPVVMVGVTGFTVKLPIIPVVPEDPCISHLKLYVPSTIGVYSSVPALGAGPLVKVVAPTGMVCEETL